MKFKIGDKVTHHESDYAVFIVKEVAKIKKKFCYKLELEEMAEEYLLEIYE